LKVVVVVALGVDSQDESGSIMKSPIKEFFEGENLEVRVSERHSPTLFVRERLDKDTYKFKVLAVFRHWEYYRIME